MEVWTFRDVAEEEVDTSAHAGQGGNLGNSVSRMMRVNISESDVCIRRVPIPRSRGTSYLRQLNGPDTCMGEDGLANEAPLIEPSPSQYRGPIHSL